MGQSLSRKASGKAEQKDEEQVLPRHIRARSPSVAPNSVPQEPPKDPGAEFAREKALLSAEKQAKIDEWKDAIQPHTDEGGDANYIGDAYEPIKGKWATEWKVENRGPYLSYIKAISEKFPHLEYLGHWMEVTCAPPKWKFLRNYPERRAERAKQTDACVIDYRFDCSKIKPKRCTSTEDLSDAIKAIPGSGEEPLQARLIVVEDLSRDVVELLGNHYDIDPLFFLSHISDYLFHTTRDRWVELPNLDVDMRKQSHFVLQYLRPRYFKTEDSFQKAERESGTFNVLRRLDSDRSRKRLQKMALDRPEGSVTLTRAKTSLWIKPEKAGEPTTAILLVDPTVREGYPLWGGHRPFQSTPSMQEWKMMSDEEKKSNTDQEGVYPTLFEDVIKWSTKITADDLETIRSDPRCLAMPMYRIVIADWLAVLKYMTTILGLIEWGFDKPHWSENVDAIEELQKKLSPWLRNIGYYQGMVSSAIARLFPAALHAQLDPLSQNTQPALGNPPAPSYDEKGILSLWTDCKNIKQQMDASRDRIRSIQTMASNSINTEEARRAVRQNKNLARLTFLATSFLPLNFTTSFLSMSPDFTSATQTIWLFFVLGIPLMLVALIGVDITHPEKEKQKCRRWAGQLKARIVGEKKPEPQPAAVVSNDRRKTIPWTIRTETSYMK